MSSPRPPYSWRRRLFGTLLGQLRLAAFTSVFIGFTTASAATLLINQRALIEQHERKVHQISERLRPHLNLVAHDRTPSRRESATLELGRLSAFNLVFWLSLPDGTLLLPNRLDDPEPRTLAIKAVQAMLDPSEVLDGSLLSQAAGTIGHRQRGSHPPPIRPDTYRVVSLGERQFLTHLHIAGPSGTNLWVAEDISANMDFLSSLLSWMLMAWSVCLTLTLLAISLTTRRIIRPLRDLNALAGSVTSSSLATSRLDVTQSPLEVQELASGYNNLLDRLSLAWEHQREFVSAVSHELRNPMTIIRGYLQRVLRRGTNLDPEQLRTLAMAEAETQRITRMLHDLLDLSRSESGRLQLVLQPVAVDEVLLTTCDLARTQLSRPLELTLPSISRERPIEALAEADRLQQVVMNLIENADKYSPQGLPIQVVLEQEGPAGLKISVIDRGIGIPPEDLPYIFNRFHRARNAAERIRGSGLGLSVVKLLVEAMGGRIDVESQLEGGSDFRIHLPALPRDGGQGQSVGPSRNGTAPSPGIPATSDTTAHPCPSIS